MTRQDLDDIAEATAKAVVRELRTKIPVEIDSQALQICMDLVEWSDNPDADLRLQPIVIAARNLLATVTRNTGHAETNSDTGDVCKHCFCLETWPPKCCKCGAFDTSVLSSETDSAPVASPGDNAGGVSSA